jgi:hypothetical protein
MTEIQRIRHKPSTVLDQIETRNRVWNPVTLDWEVETTQVQQSLSNQAQVVYEDGDILYVCKAVIGSVKTSPVWQIKKVDGMDITWCDGDDLFNNVATSLAVVELLSYS